MCNNHPNNPRIKFYAIRMSPKQMAEIATLIIEDFVDAGFIIVEDAPNAEANIIKLLHDWRFDTVTNKKETFLMSPSQPIGKI